MIGKSERSTGDFLAWEARGRGHGVWEFPVVPEPLFEPFRGHGRYACAEPEDDGRKPTLLSSFVRSISNGFRPRESAQVEEREEIKAPELFIRNELVELQAALPHRLALDLAAHVGFFGSVRTMREPAAFEIVATGKRLVVQFAIHPDDERIVRRQFASFLPDVTLVTARGFLERVWGDLGQQHVGALEFGLGKEFAIPLSPRRGDLFVGLAGALAEVAEGEIAVFQVLFSPAVSAWSESVMRSVTHGDGSAYFVNAPELLSGAREKLESPLYGVVVRLAARSDYFDRTWRLLFDVGAALGAYGSAKGNEFVPLRNDGYPLEAHERDVVRRQSRRSGMLLNATELAMLVHLPSDEVREPKLRPKVRRTKAAPAIAHNPDGLVIGLNEHDGMEVTAALSREQRARHIHVIGASGTGKSTLLFRMIMQDIEAGEGVTVLDPHGDLIDRVLGSIPEERIKDVVLLDPSDEERIVGFNILSAETDWEKNMLASDLVSVFRRLSTSWGDQLNSVLHNAILAFLKSERGGTLLDLRRFLLEPVFRAQVIATVRDPNVAYYWKKAFPQLPGSKSVGSVVTRLDTFLSPESIRYMVSQRESRLDFRDIMDGGKIFLAKLSQGAIGKDNSHLLGSLIVAKLQSAAMARQRQAESDRRWHWAYIDEFHDFLTPSIADSLTGVRKYRLGLVLGHQEMRQVEKESDVASALLANAYTRVVFRVGDRDAKTMEAGFSGFDSRDIQSLSAGEAVCRIERADFDFSITVPLPEPSDPNQSSATRERTRSASQERYGMPRSELEAALAATLAPDDEPQPKKVQRPEAPPTPHAAPANPPQPVAAKPLAPQQAAASPSPVSSDAGRGGAQHTAIQKRLKLTAEALGFRAVVEKDLGGTGSVDLALERGDVSIACEITVTTTIDHEVGNVAKCAEAGYKEIAAVSISTAKLAQLEAAVRGSLGPEVAALVRYYQPEAFAEYLKSIPAPAPVEPTVKNVKGYKVKKSFAKLTPDEAKAKEDAAIDLIANAMAKKKQG